MAIVRVSEEAKQWLNGKAYEQREPVSIVVDRMIWNASTEKLKKPVEKPKSEAKPTAKKKVRQKPKCSICGNPIDKSGLWARQNNGTFDCGDCLESGKVRERYLERHNES